jgi:hypothetical protein
MAKHTSKVVTAFDFSEPLRMSVAERFDHCIARARDLAKTYQSFSDYPCVPELGATESELAGMESALERPLPFEYRAFLSRCRYLKVDEGIEIGGLDYNGLYVTDKPWMSDKHRAGVEYFVFANYWMYADGDHLMFDMSDPDRPVIAYLHDHGPLFEAFAPSFSLALWRLLHEFVEQAGDENNEI